VGFEVGKYDASRPLYIDPLIYSTYLGGANVDSGSGIAVDGAGNAYVVGYTSSIDFPTVSPLQPANGGGYDVFVSKINPTGSALVYSTYLGGSGNDSGYGIAVNSAGDAYITGSTSSANFPVTPGAFQVSYGGGSESAFVTEVGPSGSSLVYSSFLGGSGGAAGMGIVAGGRGDAYVTGTAGSGFPVTPGAFQTACCGAFVAKMNSTGTALVYSTYLGGSGDIGYGVAVDGSANAYVTGVTTDKSFPVTAGAFQTVCNGPGPRGCKDAFVSVLNPTGSGLVYSTLLGGSGNSGSHGGNFGTAIAVDSSGDAYVTGYTGSNDFPLLNAFDSEYGGDGDGFVAKFNPTGSALIYSTYLGGANFDQGQGIAVDASGDAYVTGATSSHDFPTTPGAFQFLCKPGGRNPCPGYSFVTVIGPSGTLLYSTYLGGASRLYDGGGYGIAVDSAGDTYVTGNTSSANFPVSPSAPQTTYAGDIDAFVTKIQPVAGPVTTSTTLTSSPNPSTYGQPVTFIAMVTSLLGVPPDGETVSFMKGKIVLGTGTLNGGSATFTTSTLKVGTTSIKAVYGGDSNFEGSTSNAVKQVVEKAAD